MAPYAASDVKNTLPSSWYREAPLYELERRAVFSKSWMLISHVLQFEKPGHYVRYETAGYPFFIIRDRKGNINAFLNVCRHRAYPLVHKDEGDASILACQYHGWSYGLGGNLAKAPRFDQVEEFDNSQYSLFRIHSRIDERGFIWVNLDAAETPTTSWEEQFQGVDTQSRLQNFDMKDYAYDHTWTMDGCNFNWKTLVENYNECYHCPTAHPGLAQYIKNTTKLEYGCTRNYVLHLGGGDKEHAAVVSPTYMFPNASTTMTKNFFYMMQIVPVNATTCTMRYEFYKSTKCSVADFQADMDFYKQVEGEDKILANNTQANLNTNTYVAGPLHPNVEEAVAYFETLIRRVLKEHAAMEKVVGKQVWPARRGLGTTQENEDEAFCRGLCETANGTDGELAW